MSNEFSPEHFLTIKTSVKHSLVECLSSYSKTQVELLATGMWLSNKIKSMSKKTEIIALLQNEILNRAEHSFRYQALNLFLVTSDFAFDGQNPLHEKIETVKKDLGKDFEEYSLAVTEFALTNGYLFIFEDPENGKETFVMPDEVKEIFSRLAAQADEGTFVPGELIYFRHYAETLSSLYGVCPLDLFIKLYIRDFPDSPIENKADLKKHLHLAQTATHFFIFTDGNLLNAAVSDEWADIISEDRKNFKPYLPSRMEIEDHIGLQDYDENSEAAENMLKFLNRESKDESSALCTFFHLLLYIKMGFPLEVIFELLQEEAEIMFSRESVQKFLSLYTDLFDTTHLWTNWGHTPDRLHTESGKLDKESLSDEFIQQIRQEKEKRYASLEVPDTCVVPDEQEAEKRCAEFDAYWNKDGAPPDWHKNGSTMTQKFKGDMRKYAENFEGFPENLLSLLYDEWLASLWHVNANRTGEFGRKHWDYVAFEPVKHLRQDLFLCIRPDGSTFVLLSHGFEEIYEKARSCLAVLVDMGGWYIVYGAILWWQGMRIYDFEALARSIAPQMYDAKGLNGVVQFNPVPFWATYSSAGVPPVQHHDKEMIQCILPTRFVKNEPPQKLNEWRHEVQGKYERWISNPEDSLASINVYRDAKTGDVLIATFDEEAFDATLNDFADYIDTKKNRPFRASMPMTAFIGNKDKTAVLLDKMEKAFDKK